MSIFQYQETKGYFTRLKEALRVTKEDLSHRINQVMGTGSSAITDTQLEHLEEILIGCDIGVTTTLEILERARRETADDRFLTSFQLRRILRNCLLEILSKVNKAEAKSGQPHVVLVVGVNGVGKTTTIGKLAHYLSAQDKEVLICASDTFRAAAVDQLEIWAQRSGADIVKQPPGADPAAVLYDAIAAARARSKDVVITDTAGRLHSKVNLMKELEKMIRVASREVDGAPHETLLILDATTGQNGLVQARQFLEVVGVNGIIITKLDGTARGGIVVAVARELGIPIRFVGVGEELEDMLPFSPEEFVDSLIGQSESGRRLGAENV